MRLARPFASLAAVGLAAFALAAAPQPAATTADRGAVVVLPSLAGRNATVVVFLCFDCPVSNSYIEALNVLARQQREDGVTVVGFVPGESPAAVRKAVKEFRVGFPVRPDPQKEAAKEFGAKVTPEVFLLDARQKVRYRGRIDDAYEARLKKKARVTSHDLKDALATVLAGKQVKAASTEAVGCPIEYAAPAQVKDAKATYHRDVAPILAKHCQVCHRAGEIGPFALTTYAQARRWAQDIKQFTKSRQMPPWMPTAGGPFRDERRLSEKEVATLAAWADAGAPEGDSKDAAAAPKFAGGWRMGEPDLVLSAKDAFHLGGTGPDLFRCFVLPTGLKEHAWVVGFDVRPGAPRVVHHTVHYFDLTGTARKLEKRSAERDAKEKPADRGPGYSVAMGVGFNPPEDEKGQVPKFGGLGGWAPGQSPQKLPAGAGMFLPRGADFLLQVHYHRDGRAADDRTQVGLYFAKKPVEQPWQLVVITGMRPAEAIPAGRARHVSRGSVWLHTDALLHSVMPHMHLLGKRVKVTLTPPGGEEQVLVEIKEWDYRWQETYWFAKPILAKAGSKLEVTGEFDNSAKNPRNPNVPPKAVYVGEQTTDEMLYGFLGATSTTTPWSEVKYRSSPPKKRVPADPLRVLKQRVGSWDTETVSKKALWTAKDTRLTGTETGAMVMRGKFLECKGRTKDGEESRLLATWDEGRKTYRAWYFDSAEMTSEGRGEYDEKSKTLTWLFDDGGITSKVRWKFVSDDVMEWDMVTRDENDNVALDMKGSMKRKKE